MKTKINFLFYILPAFIVIILFIAPETAILILFAQFFVGVSNLVGSLVRFIIALVKKQSVKPLLIYWMIIVAYSIVCTLYFVFVNDNLFKDKAAGVLGLAWFIAGWYCERIVFVNKK
jgi:hypothetical protein